MASTRVLIGLFVIAFVSSFLLFLPASAVVDWSGLDKSFSYRQISGSVWRARVKDATVRGFYLGDIEYLPSLSLIYGKLAGDVKYQGRGRTAHFSFTLENETLLNMKNAVFSMPISAGDAGVTLAGMLTAHSDSLVYDLKSGCQSGELRIQTDILEKAFSNINNRAPLLTGVAVCDAGVLKATLAGKNITGEYAVNMFWRGTSHLNGYLEFKPSLKGEKLDQMTRMLQVAGMKLKGNVWQKQIAMSF